MICNTNPLGQLKKVVFKGSVKVSGNTAFPSHNVGDLLLVIAHNSGSTAIPTLPASGGTVPAYTSLTSIAGTSNPGDVVAYAFATAQNHTTGSFSGITSGGILGMVFSGVSAASPFGGIATAHLNSTVYTGTEMPAPAITLTRADNSSFLLHYWGASTTASPISVPAGYSLIVNGTSMGVAEKTNSSSDGAVSATFTGSGSNYNAVSLEILANAPGTPHLDFGGQQITYSLGSGGASPSGAVAGNAGGTTTATFMGTTITATGGVGGLYNTSSGTSAGGTGSGGDGSADGGRGGAARGNVGGNGGGGIFSATAIATSVAANSGIAGAQSVDVSGLQAAVTAAGYSWTGPGAGSATTTPVDVNHGGNATGFGCGGGGANAAGGNGGNGLLGGGGGGASGNSATQSGGAGGSGAVVCQFTTRSGLSYQVLTSGTSYTVPNQTISVKLWAIGGGGSGAGCPATTTVAGGSGGAGGTSFKTW